MNYDIKITKKFLNQIAKMTTKMPEDTEILFFKDDSVIDFSTVTVKGGNDNLGILVSFKFKEDDEQTTRISESSSP